MYSQGAVPILPQIKEIKLLKALEKRNYSGLLKITEVNIIRSLNHFLG